MRPLELGCIEGVWNHTLSILSEAVGEKRNLQLWYKWSETWYGRDFSGLLPATNLPEEFISETTQRFASRLWRHFEVKGVDWLISISCVEGGADNVLGELKQDCGAMQALGMLSDFVRLESLLMLALNILESKAKENRGHWHRIRNLSVAIANEMRLSKRETDDIEIAALLHDLGKIEVPAEVLEAPRPLLPHERAAVEAHATLGAALLRLVPGMKASADIILSHHEALDGSGYPKKLKSSEIPIGSLIIAAADAFDAMTHYRPYAIERTYQESFNELNKEKGKYSDEVLEALKNVLRRLGILDSKPLVGSSELW